MKTNRTGGAAPPKPPKKPYTAKDIADKVNKKLDGDE